MSRLDMVIFGATGFTGKRTVIKMVTFALKYKIGPWGIAGRSEGKLMALLQEVGKKTGADMSFVKIIKADINDQRSLEAMCAQTKVLINCSGPYWKYGEPVLKAAISNHTDYVDISGEPQFVEKMQIIYGEAARKAGVYIVSGCGFDSVPADMGVVFLQKNFNGTVNSVKSYLNLYVPPGVMAQSERRGIINNGTWASAIYGMANSNQLGPLREKLYPGPLPKLTPELKLEIIHKKEGTEDYYLPFIGFDERVVYRTQMFRLQQEHQRPIQFEAYFKSGAFWQSVYLLTYLSTIFLMSKTPKTRDLLLSYPEYYSRGFVSSKGPTDLVMNNTFFSFDLVGEGWENGTDVENTKPNKKVVAKVSGVNPAYGATCVALLSCAVTILQEREKLPGKGGILTTGAAFQYTNLITKLLENNVKYEIVETNILKDELRMNG